MRSGVIINVYKIDTFRANSDSADEFALLIGQKIQEITSSYKVEVCANMCKKGNSWGGVITTINSSAVCPITNLCPDGLDDVNIAIHSHIDTTSYIPNDIDRVFLNGNYKNDQRVKTDPNSFSKTDMEHAGYMISNNVLQYNDGDGNIRTVYKNK